MDINLAVKTGPNPEACVPVVGLPFADYDRVAKEITLGTALRIEPVADNPHDPLAIEVWYDGAAEPARIGFVPRDFTRALRLALDLGEMTKEVQVIREGSLSFGVPADMLIAFLKVTAPAAHRNPQNDEDDESEPDPEMIMKGYRSFFPCEELDPQAPQSGEELIEREAARLIAANPDLDPDEAHDEAQTSMEVKRSAVLDPSCKAPSIEPKIGGLPYAEAGWDWPRCPSCGEEVVFVAQVRDPEVPEDLIQIFHCADEDMECCEHWAQEEPEEYSLVRLWRNPRAEDMVDIAPEDAAKILPAHRFDDIEKKAEREAAITFGGRGCALRNQGLEDEGYRRVVELWLPEAVESIGTDVLLVLRHGKGRVVGFSDDG